MPWVESSLRNDFYFAAGVPNPAPVPDPVVPGIPGKGSAVENRGRLVVTVTDAKAGAAISGASVTVDGQSAPGGAYSLNLLTEAEKAVQITVTAPGYDGKLVSETLLRGKIVSLPVALNALAAPSPVPKPTPVPAPVPPPVVQNVNPTDGAELVLIPAGSFLMGDSNHVVTLPAYSIYKNLVAVAMYEKFCKETKREMPLAPPFNEGWSKKEHPIVNVSWNDAKACNWAGAVLPSEAQWEKAARGTDGRKFPWGDTYDNSKSWSSQLNYRGTARVGSFPLGDSPYGVSDMAGNADQWCDDWSDPSETKKIVRGGSWSYAYSTDTLRCANRSSGRPDFSIYFTGFRCVISP